MRIKIHVMFGLAFLFLASGPGLAKDYIVDMLIFENLPTNSEASLTDAQLSVLLDNTTVYYPVSRNPIRLGSANAENSGYQQLKPSDRLQAMAKKLQRSGRYRVLNQLSWQQPGLDKSQAQPIQINTGRDFALYTPGQAIAEDGLLSGLLRLPADNMTPYDRIESQELSGTVLISLGKYLHLDTNMVFTDLQNIASFKMQTHRRMRSKEVHHIDTPRIGILILILPVEEPAA